MSDCMPMVAILLPNVILAPAAALRVNKSLMVLPMAEISIRISHLRGNDAQNSRTREYLPYVIRQSSPDALPPCRRRCRRDERCALANVYDTVAINKLI